MIFHNKIELTNGHGRKIGLWLESILILAIAAASVGCDNISIEDQVVVSFESIELPVLVDTVCENGGCEDGDLLTIGVGFDEDSILQEDTKVDLLQYRVDYTINGVAGEVPYFAGPADIVVSVGQTAFADIVVAGSSQRDFISRAIGANGASGTAKLTLAGYDNFDEIVIIESEFAITFGDFYSGL